MDKIRFEIIKEKEQFFNVVVYLNECKIPHYVFNTIEVLAAFQVKESEFDLFTCTCGHSACAGFQSPIKQQKNESTVFWLFSEDYKVQKSLYCFDLEEFNLEFKKLKENVIKNSNNGLIEMSEYEYITDSNYEHKSNKLIDIEKVIERCSDEFNFKVKFFEFCKEQIPFFQNITFEYNGYKTEKYSSHDLVCAVINEWPRKDSDNKFYWGRVFKACRAINNWILNNDKTELLYLDNRSYSSLTNYDDEEYIENSYKCNEKLNLITRLSFLKHLGSKTEYLYFQEKNMIINSKEVPYLENFSINDIKFSY